MGGRVPLQAPQGCPPWCPPPAKFPPSSSQPSGRGGQEGSQACPSPPRCLWGSGLSVLLWLSFLFCKRDDPAGAGLPGLPE